MRYLDEAEGTLKDSQVGQLLVVHGGELLAEELEAFPQMGSSVLLQLVVHLSRSGPNEKQRSWFDNNKKKKLTRKRLVHPFLPATFLQLRELIRRRPAGGAPTSARNVLGARLEAEGALAAGPEESLFKAMTPRGQVVHPVGGRRCGGVVLGPIRHLG